MQREVPGADQESVWDYPRPPRVEAVTERVRIEHGGVTIADSLRALRVLETSHPPTLYLPPQDVRTDLLEPSGRRSFCEFKGVASYFTLRVNAQETVDVAWAYLEPATEYATLRGYLAFYASRVDACWWGEERVRAQPGDFYGGWITRRVVGPFKGAPGTRGW